MLPNKPRGVQMIVACSTASFGSCVQVRHGATCQRPMVPARLVTIASFVGGGLASGTRPSMRCLPVMDAAVQMIDTSVVRLHQHGACISDNNHQDMGRSRGGLTTRFMRWWTPMAYWSMSPSRPVKLMAIRCVRFCSAPCFHKRCYSRIVDTTRTGSGSLPASKELGRTFRRNAIAKTRSASARICIARATRSNGSSTRSSNVGASRRDTTNSPPTISRSSNSLVSEFGCALMSPRSSGLSPVDWHGSPAVRRG